MIFNSIKWRLQLWYGLILLAVLAGFGVTAFQLERGRQMRRIDGELMRRVNLITGGIRQPMRDGPPGERPLHRPPLNQPSGLPPEEQPGPPPDRPEFNPPDDEGRPERGSSHPPSNFHLPPQAARLFDAEDPNGFYFVFWWRDGSEVAHSTNAPELVPPPRRQSGGEPQPPRTRDGFREAFLFTPPGEVILVGRNIAAETKELRHIALKLTVVGGAVLLFGLAGGWWLASRAIRPIADISATAAKISTGDLSQRIPARDTESELGQLATVLNSTFARLEASFAQQQQFTSDAAHELRTPVSVILTQTQSTLNKERSAAEYRETLEACQRAAQRMRRLTESLLQLARMDSGQETFRREPFNLATAAQNCVELLRPLAAERNVTIHTDLAETNCNGDSDRFAQVVTNLMTNAIKYNRDGGEIRVTTRRENNLAILTVTDTGMGISAEDLPRVFERFYRADKARSSSQGNAGLGLAICKAIVEAHGGTIQVSSEPSAGTTITVSLPAVTSP